MSKAPPSNGHLTLKAHVPDPPDQNPPLDKAPDELGSMAYQFVNLALEKGLHLFRDHQGARYARFPVEGHQEVHRVDSSDFSEWLRHLIWEKKRVAGPMELQGAIETFKMKAKENKVREKVFLRVAEIGGAAYVDLGDEERRCVEISQGDWRLLSNHEIPFRQVQGMKGLPLPERGGDLREMRRFINIQGEPDWLLTVTFLLAALEVEIPYPILSIFGRRGSGKSAVAEILRDLIDPHDVELESLPSSERDAVATVQNAHIQAYDNETRLTVAQENFLCRLTSGGGAKSRALRTDCDVALHKFNKPVIMSSIHPLSRREDVVSRTIRVEIPPLDGKPQKKRKTWLPEWLNAKPRVLGALLTVYAKARAALPSVPELTVGRLSDVAALGYAAAPSLGFTADEFLSAWRDNQVAGEASILESQVVLEPLRRFAAEQGGRWKGPAEELLHHLARLASAKDKASREWPASGNLLSRLLVTELGSILSQRGLSVIRGEGKDRNKTRFLEVALA